MAMTFPYCNTTSDLQYVFKDIERFSGKETIDTFTQTPASIETFDKRNTGYVGAVYEDGVPLTEYTTDWSDVDTNSGSWLYDSANDILYVNCTDGADPDTHTIQIAVEDWDTLKTYMSERAFQQLESMLDPKYPRPIPFASAQYNGFNYDSDIVECAAILTCINIIKHRDPDNPLIKTLQDRVWNAQEEVGVMWEYSKGLRAFSFECTADQFNGNVETLVHDTTSTGLIHLAGMGDRSGRYVIRVKITTAGAVGTAKWKYSIDGETTWSSEITTAYNYTPLFANLYLKFTGTFVLNDKWEIKIAGDPEQTTRQGFRSIKLRRN